MKKEIPIPAAISLVVVLVAAVVVLFARNVGGGDPSQLRPGDYQYEPGEVRAKLQAESTR
ncbi:MAG: hypothetical protein SNJ74_00720 [Fimbriimonadaceae bacterium]